LAHRERRPRGARLHGAALTYRDPAPAFSAPTPARASRGEFAQRAADARAPAHTNDSGDKR
uniref:hypothetical protein n=1 Tax=Burkholderia humptydooensis TaxID=430531 RepID=UPI001E562205